MQGRIPTRRTLRRRASPAREQRTQRPDPTISDLPLPPDERIWNFRQLSTVSIGLAVGTFAFLQGAAVADYVGAKQAVASIVIGYGISIMLVTLAPCIPAVKYGVEQFVGLRSTFGERGARLVMVTTSAILTVPWSAMMADVFGDSIVTAVNQVAGTKLPGSGGVASVFAVLTIAVSWLVLSHGPVSIEEVCAAIAPFLVLIVIGIAAVIFTHHSWAEIAALPPLDAGDDPHTNFMLAVELNLAEGFSWWPFLGNLARLTKNSRAVVWSNSIGIFGATVVAAIVGALAALSLRVDDPTQWMIPLAGTGLGIFALSVVGLASFTAILSEGYAATIALKGASPSLHRAAWPLLCLVLLGPAGILIFFPLEIEPFDAWVVVALPALCAVQLVDFFVLRRRRISIDELYRPISESCYRYWKGVNVVAVAAVAVGIGVYALLLDPIAYEPAGPFRYVTASLPAFLAAGAVHYTLTRLLVTPRAIGGYGTTVPGIPLR